MGNLCCRRVAYNTYSPTAYICSNRSKKSAPPPPSQQTAHKTEAGPAMTSYHSSDDCAINELLEGRMELEVVLPDGRTVRLTVERRTPMMDLLVQATSANKISPGGHVIHIWTERGKDFIHYKPSTPIGSLDTNTIYIVPKKEIIEPPIKRMPKLANQPFEPTFRLQVHLPRNQLMVLRVSKKLTMSELKLMVCKDKNLDTKKYQLVHPSQPSRAMDGVTTLAQYGFAEISLLSISSIQSNLCHSTSDLIAYSSREDDRKKKGILALMSRKGCESVSSSSDEFDSPGDFHNKKDHQVITQAPKPPLKKRPAPLPPPSGSNPARPQTLLGPNMPLKKKQTGGGQSASGAASSHSRHSSDSSGYHEASLFDESPEHSAPETSSGSSGVSSLDGLLLSGDDTKPSSKKRKAPQPPMKQSQKDQLNSIKNTAPNITVAQVSVSHEDVSLTSAITSSITTAQKIKSMGKDLTIQNSMNQSGTNELVSTITATLEKRRENVEILLKTDSTDGRHGAIFENKNATKENIEDINKKNHVLDDEVGDGDEISRSSSSSLTNIDELQDSFDKTIAEAQRIIEQEDKEKKPQQNPSKGSDQAELDADRNPVTKLALTTINALIKQDVTQREIASHIEAAFYNLDDSDNKALSTQDVKEDDWQYPLPPAPQVLAGCAATPTPFLLAIKQRKSGSRELEKDSSRGQQTTTVTVTERPRSCDVNKSRLNNFTIGSYCEKSRCDGQSSPVAEKNKLAKSESFCDVDKPGDNPRKGKYGGPGIRIRSFVERNSKQVKPNDNKVYGVEGSVRGIKGQVRRRRSELLDWTPPSVLARSSSLLDLSNAIPEKATTKAESSNRGVATEGESNLKRSLSEHSLEQKSEFLAEQERLQEEYLKLQKQFVLWQKQLLTNHAVLQEEKIMPADSSSPGIPPRTLRQSQSLPNGVPEETESNTFENESSGTGASLVLRSLSYEPTTLPRAAINIPVLDVNGSHTKNGSSSLRSSTTKTHFKPPQIRPSTKSRQRLPPEVRKEDDSGMDLLSRIHEELKSSSLILPPRFPSKNTNGETPAVTKLQAIFQNGMKHENVAKSEGPRSLNIVTKEISKDVRRSVDDLASTKPITNGFSTLPPEKKTVPPTPKREFLKTDNRPVVLSKSKNPESSVTPASKTVDTTMPPPPPPPMPVMENPKSNMTSTAKPTGKKVRNIPTMDPREELMLEIRNFRGRLSLKKTSLDVPNGTTTVYNTVSAESA